jgi:hypothetical protein
VQQAPGPWRSDLHRHDLSVPGREVGGNASELATYTVEKGKPFLVVVD